MGWTEKDAREMQERVERLREKKDGRVTHAFIQDPERMGAMLLREDVSVQEQKNRSAMASLEAAVMPNTLMLVPSDGDSLESALYSGTRPLSAEQMLLLGFVCIPIRAMGAVRTTKNIAVMPLEKIKSANNKAAKRRWIAYCEYKDAIRKAIGSVAGITRVEVVCEIEPPKSWTKRGRLAAMGKLCWSKPDGDNILKGIMDAVLTEDKGVGMCMCTKWWGMRDCIWVRLL